MRLLDLEALLSVHLECLRSFAEAEEVVAAEANAEALAQVEVSVKGRWLCRGS